MHLETTFPLILFSLVQFVKSLVLPMEGLYKLDIIHFNDFHARFEETLPGTPVCRHNSSSCLGGFPRLYRAISDLKREKPHSILLNAGDSFQGTYWYTLLKWNVTQEFMNLLPHDAHAIGNHDFDDGPEGLALYLSALKAPVLAANMDASRVPILQNLYEAYIILERGGRKIGIIGLITPDTKQLSFTGDVNFTDPHAATRREAEKLTELGVDIVVVLSHCGYDVDIALAREHGQYIDVIVGGHSHRDESFTIPYRTIVEADAEKNKKVVVVQAFVFTQVLGNLSVYFDANGDVVKWEGVPIYLDRSVPQDEEIQQKLAPYAKLVHAAENIPIAVLESDLNYNDCLHGECKLGNLLVDALNHWAKETTNRDVCISFVQRSNIVAILPKGLITKGSIIELFPYYDFVETFELKGKYILKALERSVSELSSVVPLEAPWLLQVSGLHVKYNISKPEGRRLVKVYIGDPEAGDELNEESFYQVTAPAYLADGGDGYTIFRDVKQNVKLFGRDQILLQKYIEKFSALSVCLDGRIDITY